MRLASVAFVVAACGQSDPPKPVVPPAQPALDPIACPGGAIKQRPWRQRRSEDGAFVSTEGREEWCERSDGKRDGAWRITYMNGKLAASGAYQNDARTGLFSMWYGDADRPWKAEEETWVAGVRQGSWRSFRPDNGKPWAASSFKDGKLDGDWIEYGEDGKPHVVGTFVAGEPQGSFTRTLPDGTTHAFAPNKADYDPKPIGE